ncbi:hypothetical protein [Leptospira stimsonii]|uniref:Serine protease n=1 Tax=Leptospira stimsonii TaxID=2202203 RepID=A0ABY2MXZ9_9LEPT|nr:hypothetical protein [Leptospira stimsonii]TGK10699.1 hypothetical protein EHO98_22660 [Leptospira stimsonii]TGM11094.1 hypothetical protein EHQ90_16795 [Leptospira stimsonii]
MEISEILKKVKSDSRLVDSFTIQMFALNKRKRPECIGNGVLFSHDNKYFIFSAAHVFEQVYEDQGMINLFYAVSGSLNEVFSGSINIIHSANVQNWNEDPIDLAIVELSSESVVRIQRSYKFATIENIDSEFYINAKDIFFIYGYPASGSKPNPIAKKIKSKPILYSNNPNTEIFNKSNFIYNSENHIALTYNINRIKSYFNQIITGMHPRGASGTGLWKLTGVNPEKFESKLSGIFIEFLKEDNRVLMFTRIHLILFFLNKDYNLKIAFKKTKQ